MPGTQPSELIEISKLNGDFKKNYGTLIGAFLFLCALNAARGRSHFLERRCARNLRDRPDLVEEARLAVVRRPMSDRARTSKRAKRSMP